MPDKLDEILTLMKSHEERTKRIERGVFGDAEFKDLGLAGRVEKSETDIKGLKNFKWAMMSIASIASAGVSALITYFTKH